MRVTVILEDDAAGRLTVEKLRAWLAAEAPCSRVTVNGSVDSLRFTRDRAGRLELCQEFITAWRSGRVETLEGWASWHGVSGRTLRRWLAEFDLAQIVSAHVTGAAI